MAERNVRTTNVSMNVAWEIKNFSCYWLENDFAVTSPVFKSCSNFWILRLQTLRSIEEDSLTVYLSRVNGDPQLTLNCVLELVSSGPEKVKTEQENIDLKGSGYVCSKTLLKGKGNINLWKESFLINDSLTIRCKVWNQDNKIDQISHFISTVIGFEKVSFNWVIPDFVSLFPKTKIHKTVPSAIQPLMALSLFHEQDIVKIEASLEDNSKRTHVKFDVSLKSENMKYQRMVEHTFPTASIKQVAPIFPDYISRSTLLASMKFCPPENALTLQCVCIVSSGIVSEQVTYNPSRLRCLSQHLSGESFSLNNTLQPDLKKMYEDRSWCDFEICCRSGDKFPVHRSILVARAPALKSLVGTDTSPRDKETVNLPDLEAYTLNQVLLFLYTDIIGDMDYKSAIKLYLAADKYQIHSLRQKCLNLMQVTPDVSEILELNKTEDEELKSLTMSYLKTNLNTGNACDILCAVDPFKDRELKALAQDFIAKHDAQVLVSKPWKKVIKRRPDMAAETLQDICLKRIKLDTVSAEVKEEPKY